MASKKHDHIKFHVSGSMLYCEHCERAWFPRTTQTTAEAMKKFLDLFIAEHKKCKNKKQLV